MTLRIDAVFSHTLFSLCVFTLILNAFKTISRSVFFHFFQTPTLRREGQQVKPNEESWCSGILPSALIIRWKITSHSIQISALTLSLNHSILATLSYDSQLSSEYLYFFFLGARYLYATVLSSFGALKWIHNPIPQGNLCNPLDTPFPSNISKHNIWDEVI